MYKLRVPAASLGQLAIRAQLLPPPEYARLQRVLQARARAGTPVSLGRLLVKGGLSSRELRALLRQGAQLDAVTCDACQAEVPQAGRRERREFPCPQCGALLLAFLPFARESVERRPEHRTQEVTVLPSGDDSEQTIPTATVLPLPEEPPGGTDLDVATPAPIPSSENETLVVGAAEGSTLGYGKVLELPDGGATTIDFNYVFVLPSSEGARSDEATIHEFSELSRDSEDLGAALPGELPGDAPAEIAEFEVLRLLGEGTVGKVFLAKQKGLAKLVALKVLRPEMARDQDYLYRFKREARAASRVRDPHVVQVVKSGVDPRTKLHYIALEYIDGGSLHELLVREATLPEQRTLEITRDVCRALAAAEAVGVIHRDVKPENILVCSDGTVKLADLGLAKQIASATQITESGMVVGTPVYIAPEQAVGKGEVDIRSDLFAVGLVMWEMLAGRLPFDDETATALEVMVRHIEEEIPDIRIYAPKTSDGVAQIVRGLCARDPEQRYRSPRHVLRDIQRIFLDQAPLGASSTVLADDPTTDLVPEVLDAAQPNSPLAKTAISAAAPAETGRGVGSWIAIGCALIVGGAGLVALIIWAGLWARYLLNR